MRENQREENHISRYRRISSNVLTGRPLHGSTRARVHSGARGSNATANPSEPHPCFLRICCVGIANVGTVWAICSRDRLARMERLALRDGGGGVLAHAIQPRVVRGLQIPVRRVATGFRLGLCRARYWRPCDWADPWEGKCGCLTRATDSQHPTPIPGSSPGQALAFPLKGGRNCEAARSGGKH
jgi:hypothetical protein